MKTKIVLTAISQFLAIASVASFKETGTTRTFSPSEEVGDALLLTPLISAGRIEEAQNLSRVRNLTDVVSYSGYLTVNAEYESNMFFWFFPAAINPDDAPLLVWLQGGPGSSSLYGLFAINGPFIIRADQSIELRNTSWTLTHNVIYFDNPVGTGYSYTNAEEGYARNETDVARDLYEAIQQFLVLFPRYQTRDFYLSGESYAGKYVPAIAYKIHSENKNSPQIRINLKGLAIGNGLTDPISQLGYGEALFHLGLIDTKQRSFIAEQEAKSEQLILQGNYSEAYGIISQLLFGDENSSIGHLENITGVYMYNYLRTTANPEEDYFVPFVQSDHIRRSIHVGAAIYGGEGEAKVFTYLRNDIYQSVKPWLEELLDAPEKYRIMIYSGSLDIVCASALTEKMISSLKWSGASDFATTARKVWQMGNDVAGYTKSVGNFTHVVIRNAGHAAPADQPERCFQMINAFTSGEPI